MMRRTEKDDDLKVGDYFYMSDILARTLEPKAPSSLLFILKKLAFMDTVHIKFGIFDNKFGRDIYKVTNITKYKIENIFMEDL